MIPLSEKLRPHLLKDIVGQKKTCQLISHVITKQRPISILFHGPPGSGKTTLAKIYGKSFTNAFYKSISAIGFSTADVKKLLNKEPFFQQKIILFIDEIHRLNKAQQDLFLPFIEEGKLILIGATTENLSFVINNALLSRMRVVSLEALENSHLDEIIKRYESKENKPPSSKNIRDYLIELSCGDARHLLNLLENIQDLNTSSMTKEDLSIYLQDKKALYDRDQDGHYQLISALHKSIRGSDPDSSIYWLARMLEGGEDPLFITRRLMRIAAEDVGLADPKALDITLSSHEIYQRLGSPEGEIVLFEAVIYLALAPKSNATYTAMKKAQEDAKKTSHLFPPKYITNASTNWMKEMEYSKGYIYDHDTEKGFSGQEYFPEKMDRKTYYEPLERGWEREMKKRLDYFINLRSKINIF